MEMFAVTCLSRYFLSTVRYFVDEIAKIRAMHALEERAGKAPAPLGRGSAKGGFCNESRSLRGRARNLNTGIAGGNGAESGWEKREGTDGVRCNRSEVQGDNLRDRGVSRVCHRSENNTASSLFAEPTRDANVPRARSAAGYSCHVFKSWGNRLREVNGCRTGCRSAGCQGPGGPGRRGNRLLDRQRSRFRRTFRPRHRRAAWPSRTIRARNRPARG